MNNCWIIPRNAPACRRDVQSADRKELRDGGYVELRLFVNGETDQVGAAVYVQGWPTKLRDHEWMKAAWGMFGTYTNLRVTHSDGTPVFPYA